MDLKERINNNAFLRKVALWLLMPPGDPRPRWWIRNLVNPLKHARGRRCVIRKNARLDLFPFNNFSAGNNSIIEDFAIINNGVGDVYIGNNTIIGVGTAVIAPVEIGNNVMLAQHVVISGLNHNYQDVHISPKEQEVNCKKVTIEDNVWIGANAVITAGVTIGRHAVIGAGSVVTKNIPPYSVAVGNPATVVKHYNSITLSWENNKNKDLLVTS